MSQANFSSFHFWGASDHPTDHMPVNFKIMLIQIYNHLIFLEFYVKLMSKKINISYCYTDFIISIYY